MPEQLFIIAEPVDNPAVYWRGWKPSGAPWMVIDRRLAKQMTEAAAQPILKKLVDMNVRGAGVIPA